MKNYNLPEEKRKEAEEYLKRFAESKQTSEEEAEEKLIFKDYIKYLKERE